MPEPTLDQQAEAMEEVVRRANNALDWAYFLPGYYAWLVRHD